MENSLKRRLFIKITSQGDYLGKYADGAGIMEFLQQIWTLRDMPSKSDGRYKDQYGSIYQHVINNPNDWTTEHLYEDELNLIQGDESFFIKFVDTVMSPLTRQNKNDIFKYLALINNELSLSDYGLFLSAYLDEDPVYQMKKKGTADNLPPDITPNDITIFKGIAEIDKYPCFYLLPNSWDDFGYQTTTELYYATNKSEFRKIGELKIMKRDTLATWSALPQKFTQLPNDFCSLGQSEDFYFSLKDLFPEKYNSTLLAFKDVAFSSKILEQFEKEPAFRKSLIRDNKAEQLLRYIQFKILGIERNYFTFTFKFKAPYSENVIPLHFNFNTGTFLKHRVMALIGKNGTGKTSVLSSLIRELSFQNTNSLTPHRPPFSKYFTVSYSVFDHFPIPDPSLNFNYVYCGLKTNSGGLITEDEQLTTLLEAIQRIKDRGLLDDWSSALSNFFPDSYLDKMFEYGGFPFEKMAVEWKQDGFEYFRKLLSSGESIMLYIVTRIISEIRLNSLILYDEPETHLHPNAISALMNTLFSLTNKFDSFCVLATHSPLIVREIHAADIIIFDRQDDELHIKNMERDSFGENLTVITEDIFDNRDANKHHLELMKAERSRRL